jgi:tetratricopeptide (TPR) repeat protein
MSADTDPRGTLEVALRHASRLLKSDPRLAIEQAQEILNAVPNQPGALLVLGAARRACGQIDDALAVLEPLTQAHPNWAEAHYELGLALGAKRRGEAAVTALRRAVELKPTLAGAWRTLADHLRAVGDLEGADQAYARHIRASTTDPRLLEAAAALVDDRIAVAEALLREHLKQFPTDVAAIRMLAEVASRLGRYIDAENLLARCLELAPGFTPARHNYAFVLHRAGKPAQALAEVDRLLAADPRNPGYRSLKAAIVTRVGDVDQAIELYGGVLAEYPGNAKAWMSYGHALKTAGKLKPSIEAYRKSLEIAPTLGETWWSLANLKTFRFSHADVEEMQRQLAQGQLTAEDRFHFHFALGKALEDAEQFEASFHHYEQGNAQRRALASYDANETTAYVQRAKTLLTREFFGSRAGMGCPAPDPIFIVGLPRSGSTLLEQILASHPQVEGTQELPNIPGIVRDISGQRLKTDVPKYPQALADLSAEDLRALGERYMSETRIQRRTDAPFFIDKLPNNWAHVGLIHLILPNARIIDARRHPMGCCFSCFKQHFARGQLFTYNLEDLGRYYRDYVELMAHYDAVLPGRVHRVIYETLVDDTEAEIRRLLQYCGLPFDEACLRFYENDRAVRTPSAEQVRQPIFRAAVEHWRHYEPWLGALKSALGPVLTSYPHAPSF